MIYRYFQECSFHQGLVVYWQMVFFYTHVQGGCFVCLNCYSRIYRVTYGFTITRFYCYQLDQVIGVWIIWQYQMGNRQVQSQILRITAFDRVVSCQTLQIPVSVKSMADEFYCFAPTFDCSTVTPTKISTRQTADTLFNLGDGRKEKTVD